MKVAYDGSDYAEVNRRSWNARVDIHYASNFYDVEKFLAGRSSLNSIETALLGDVAGQSVLHLQCHFGQDSISLARLGARVTGVDLSDRAIHRARALAQEAGIEPEACRFVCCDVYEVPREVSGVFDLVFTTYGVLGWLPDLKRWGEVVAGALAPGGRLLLVEFHPFIWMWDDELEHIAHRYFASAPIRETYEGTYADPKADLKLEDVTWNHGLAEVVTALLDAGLVLTHLEEHDHSPYPCFPRSVEVEPGKYRLAPFADRAPLVYALVARKPAK